MNFKRFHISTNLLDFDALENAPSGIIGTSTVTHLLILTLKPNTVYTVISNGQGSTGGSAGDNRCIYVNGTNIDNVAFAGHPVTGTTPVSGEMKIGFFSERSNAQQYINGDAQVWLVEGSDATVPYEPYGDTWHNIPHYIHNTATDTLTTLPADIYANDTTATVGLKGDMSQSSTPSPTTPIEPSECGERTGNLFDKSTLVDGKGLDANGAIINYPKRCTISVPINVSEFDDVTISFASDVSNTKVIYALFNGSTLIRRESAIFSGSSIDVSSGNSLYICFYETTDLVTVTSDDLSNIMLNIGETALPYEPYGVKIPILSGGTTTPIYLGEVQTTRKIKKLVFTGQENWQRQTLEHTNIINLFLAVDNAMGNSPIYSNIVTYYSDSGLTNDSRANVGKVNSTGVNLLIDLSLSDFSTINTFKTYLQQQYAAGTPVCVWYVLATPQTAVVNEPIRKIGDYADTVSGITIPTTAGANTLSIGTTLQPSEVTVNYKGWHPVQSVHEKSKNLLNEAEPPQNIYITDSIKRMGYEVEVTAGTYTAYGDNSDLYAKTKINGIYGDAVQINNPQNLTLNSDGIIIIYSRVNGEFPDVNIMLNTGSTALPYEPYWT